jgi:hypothetical protein
MNNTLRTPVNKEVTVTSMYFKNRSQHLQAFPRRIEFEGNEYTFVESGFRYLVKKGQRFVELFDMTDGVNSYRLKFDNNEHTWTLVGMGELPRALA